MSDERNDINGEIYMLTSDECPSCIETKKVLEKEISEGKIKELKIETEEAAKIIDALGIREIPAFILKDGKKVCKLDDSFKIVECKELEE
ncbi:MAG: hypothetical protein QXQ95_08700 [Thermofilum sp.]|uniref:hypothetical protein n=1 Tax=Thermofilum sp. TaxID=1961369 RepID=UPI0031777C7D